MAGKANCGRKVDVKGNGGGTMASGCCCCSCLGGFGLLVLPLPFPWLVLVLLLVAELVRLTMRRLVSSAVARFSFCSSILRCLRAAVVVVVVAAAESSAPTETVMPVLSLRCLVAGRACLMGDVLRGRIGVEALGDEKGGTDDVGWAALLCLLVGCCLAGDLVAVVGAAV